MQGALTEVEGVKSATVSPEEQRVVVTHTTNADLVAQLIAVVEETGFEAEEWIPELETK